MTLIKSRRASIALISILIVSAVTLILVVGMSEVHLGSAYESLYAIEEKMLYYAGEGCLEESLLRAEADLTFTGMTLDFNNDTVQCTSTLSGSPSPTIQITVSGPLSTQHFTGETDLVTQGTANNLTLTHWTEQ